MNYQPTVDDDLQKAIDDITKTTDADPIFSDPVAAPAPVGPFPVATPAPASAPAPKPAVPKKQVRHKHTLITYIFFVAKNVTIDTIDSNINIVYNISIFLFLRYISPNVKIPNAIDKLPNNSSTILTKSSDAYLNKYCSCVKYTELHQKNPIAKIKIYFKLFLLSIKIT